MISRALIKLVPECWTHLEEEGYTMGIYVNRAFANFPRLQFIPWVQLKALFHADARWSHLITIFQIIRAKAAPKETETSHLSLSQGRPRDRTSTKKSFFHLLAKLHSLTNSHNRCSHVMKNAPVVPRLRGRMHARLYSVTHQQDPSDDRASTVLASSRHSLAHKGELCVAIHGPGQWEMPTLSVPPSVLNSGSIWWRDGQKTWRIQEEKRGEMVGVGILPSRQAAAIPFLDLIS